MVATAQSNAITQYMHSEAVKARFAEVVGERNVGPYIASVMLAVANDESGKLRQCTPQSVYVSALRAAALRLSVDPSTGQAYLVPFANKATLIVGYKGLQDMAVRTGRYRFINSNYLYEGESVEIDRITGAAKIVGARTGNKIAGWVCAFEMTNGFSKVIYMTVDEIHEYAKAYSKSYDSTKSPWQSKKRHDVEEMERKTVLRILLRKWGYLDPSDVQTLEDVENSAAESEEAIEGEIADAPEETNAEEPKSELQIMSELGFDEPAAEKPVALKFNDPHIVAIFAKAWGCNNTTAAKTLAEQNALGKIADTMTEAEATAKAAE